MQRTQSQPTLRVILPSHVERRIAQRGGDLAAVERRVRQAHQIVQERHFLLGLPLALQGGDVVPIVEFRQRGTRAVVATVLRPDQRLKPGTLPLDVPEVQR